MITMSFEPVVRDLAPSFRTWTDRADRKTWLLPLVAVVAVIGGVVLGFAMAAVFRRLLGKRPGMDLALADVALDFDKGGVAAGEAPAIEAAQAATETAAGPAAEAAQSATEAAQATTEALETATDAAAQSTTEAAAE